MRAGPVPKQHELAPRQRAIPIGPASRFGEVGPLIFLGECQGVGMAENKTGLSPVERIKEASHGLRGSLASELAAATSHFEDDTAQLLKFHGVYQQDDRDLRRERSERDEEPAYAFMVRCKIPGGVLTAGQYLALDDLAERYGNGTLRVTTRQDNQFHGVLKGDLKATIRALNDALVTTLGACGDVQRNVMCCPAPLPGGLRDQALAVARRVSQHLLPRTGAYHEIWLNGEQVGSGPPVAQSDPIYGGRYLPRKFKTAIAFPDDNCTDVYSNDLGFLAIPAADVRDRLAGFNVLVGGGLGMTHGKKVTYPRLADPLGFAPPEQVVEVAEAVITVQRDYGDRSDRRHARLKYLLDDRGLEWFRAQVEQRLGRPLAPPAAVRVSDVHDHLGWHDQGGGRSFYGLFIENGRLRDTDDSGLRTAVRRIVHLLGTGVHFTPQQNLLFTGIDHGQRETLESVLADHGVRSADAVSTVVWEVSAAGPGSTGCDATRCRRRQRAALLCRVSRAAGAPGGSRRRWRGRRAEGDWPARRRGAGDGRRPDSVPPPREAGDRREHRTRVAALSTR